MERTIHPISSIVEQLGFTQIFQQGANDHDLQEAYDGPVDAADKGLGAVMRRVSAFANGSLATVKTVALDQVDNFVSEVKEIAKKQQALESKFGELSGETAGAKVLSPEDARFQRALDATVCSAVLGQTGLTMEEGSKVFTACANTQKSRKL